MKAMAEIERRARELADSLQEAGMPDMAFDARLIVRIAESQIELEKLEKL